MLNLLILIYLFSSRKCFWKTSKNNRRLRKKTSWGFKRFKIKRTKSLEGIFPEGYGNVEIKDEINKNKEYEIRSIEKT